MCCTVAHDDEDGYSLQACSQILQPLKAHALEIQIDTELLQEPQSTDPHTRIPAVWLRCPYGQSPQPGTVAFLTEPFPHAHRPAGKSLPSAPQQGSPPPLPGCMDDCIRTRLAWITWMDPCCQCSLRLQQRSPLGPTHRLLCLGSRPL